MKIKVPLKKLMQNQTRPALKRVMEKWTRPKDVYAFIKIAEALDEAQKQYSETMKLTTETLGVNVGDTKSVDAQVITDYLLSEYGRVGKDGKWTLEGAPENSVKEFLEEKKKAEKILAAYVVEMDKLLDTDTEIDILRTIKVTESDIKKEIINAHEVYVLLMFLDLSEVGGSEATAEEKSSVETED